MRNGNLAKSLLHAVAVQVAAEFERQQSEIAMLESKARAETLFGAITDAVFVHAVSRDGSVGKFIEVNDVACRHLGYRREELLNLSPFDIDAPESEVDLEPVVEGVFAGQSVSFEQTHVAKDGRRIPVEIHTRMFDYRGSPAVISLVRDISERRKAEENLRQFEHIVSISTDMLALLDRDFIYRAANQAYLTAWDKSHDEVVGHTVAEVVGEEFFNSVVKPRALNCLAGEIVNFQEWFTFAGDKQRYMDINYYPYIDSNSEVAGFVLNGRDITERKKAEDELRHFEHIVSTSTDILALLDRDFTYLAANQAYLAAWARSQSELVGNTAVEIVGEEFFESIMKPNALRCFAEGAINFQAWYEYPAHEQRYMDFNYYPYANDEGEVVGFVISGRDITERHRTEQSLAVSYKMLDAVSDAQSKFISDASPNKLFDELLAVILDVTGCGYGFIGQVLQTEEGSPYLRNFATTDISWNEETRAYYKEHADSGLEFHNLKSLFGEVILTGEPVIANDAPNDSRGCGVPDGHPRLDTFLGLPIRSGGELVGMVGLANMPGGFSEDVVEFLKPLTSSCAQIIAACRNDQQRLQAVERMRQSEEKFRSLFESASDGIFMVDLEGNLIDFNSAAHERLGYSKEEMLAMRIFEVDTPSAASRVPERLEELRRHGHACFESEHQRKDGTVMPVEVNARLIDYEGRAVSLAIIRDISERKQAERELRQTMHALGERVKELRCLHRLSRLAELGEGSMDDYLQQAVKLLPPALQYPEMVCARITCHDREFLSDNFNASKICLSSPIVTHGEQVGRVEVCYMEGVPETETGPFLAEEVDLIEAIAAHLGRTIMQRSAEKQLRENEEKFRSLAEQSPNMIFICHEGHIAFVNEQCCQLMGYEMDELYAPDFDIHYLIEPEQRGQFDANIQRQMSGETVPPYECAMICKDGSKLNTIHNTKRIDYGRSQAILGIVTDISAQKRLSEDLSRSQSRLQFINDNAPDYIFQLRRDGTVIYVNRMPPGFSQDDVLGSNMRQWMTADYHGAFAAAMEKAFESKSMTEYESEGSITGRSYSNRISPIVTVEGVEGAILVAHDITDRKQAERDLAAKEQELNTIFEYAPVIAFYKDRQGRFLRVNRLLAERLGKSENELIGKSAFDLYPPEIARSMASDDNEVLATGRSRLGIVEEVETIVGKRWVQTDKIPTFTPDGEVTGLVGFAADITERKHAEEQLRQAQKMEAVGTLVGGIAHDFNNMLAAIKANVYLARVKPGNEAALNERLANIEQVASSAAEMVQQLLAFARKDIISTSALSLNGLLKEGLKLARAIVPENIEYRLDICSRELIVRGDATQLQQVLMNLLNNARDAVAGVSVPVIGCSLAPYTADEAFKARHAVKQDDFACWSVTDNGCGIEEEKLQKIFEPFFTTKEVGKGTGLGLAMMYAAIKSHGGVVEVESEPGKGTAFRMYLPVSIEEPDAASGGQKIRMKGQGETILLVDDEQSVRSSGKSVLEDLGYRVMEAADGEQALEIFKANQADIHLLMTDVIMPKLNGTDLVTRIRSLSEGVPVILVTGYDRGHVLDEHLQMERCDIISKPFNFDDLSQRIRRLLDAG